jgi:CRISPR type III-B/RAMP module RAMP protein Cmr6
VTGPGRPGTPRPSVPRRPGVGVRPAVRAAGGHRVADDRPLLAAGPLGKVIVSDGTGIRPTAGFGLSASAFGDDANALVIMHRVAFYQDGKLAESGQRDLLKWATGSRLGQQPAMLRAVTARRARAIERLRAQGQHVVRLLAVPEWQLAIGLGNKANPHEIGLSLHGTYGWPVIPGSALKGLTAAWATAERASDEAEADGIRPDDVRRVFGTPRLRPDPPAERGHHRRPGGPTPRPDQIGTVHFLDAIPAGEPVKVRVDVLTPHVKPYYETTRPGSARPRSTRPPEPPAEYHSPVPVNFLTVSGAFAVDLFGRAADAGDVKRAAAWLAEAGDDLGAGAKTAAGYGFLSVSPAEQGEASG